MDCGPGSEAGNDHRRDRQCSRNRCQVARTCAFSLRVMGSSGSGHPCNRTISRKRDMDDATACTVDITRRRPSCRSRSSPARRPASQRLNSFCSTFLVGVAFTLLFYARSPRAEGQLEIPHNRDVMVRTQVRLTDRQAQALRRRANRENVSLAELVRQAIDAFTQTEPPGGAPALGRELRDQAIRAAGGFASGIHELQSTTTTRSWTPSAAITSPSAARAR